MTGAPSSARPRARAGEVEPGVAMAELAKEVEHQMRLRGSTRRWASGREPIAEGEAVMFDVCAEGCGRVLNTLSRDMPIRQPA
jgi:hypothetical protein